MKAQIITIGDEILIGQTIDTNSAWIGSELSKLGFDIQRITSIHDNRIDILGTLNEVITKSDVVLITGGLGPTSDDITKTVLCEFFNTHLVVNEDVLFMIEEMMKKRNFTMNENNRKQAEVPKSCVVLKNATGTAPGMWFEKDGTIFISMPGVPYEMKHIMSEHVLPELSKRFTSQAILHRNIMTYGLPEAKLAEVLTDFEAELPGFIKLAYLPSSGIIKLRLTCTGKELRKLAESADEQVSKLHKIIPELIFADQEESFESVIGKLLRKRNMTICTAESCTGGRLASMITSIPGSSAYFKGSVVAYSNTIKSEIIGVKQETIQRYGAVSEEVVIEMAEGIRKKFNTDYSVATSGIAGPDGGSPEKPVGTLWIAVASGRETVAFRHLFGNSRITNLERFSIAALNYVRKQIIKG